MVILGFMIFRKWLIMGLLLDVIWRCRSLSISIKGNLSIGQIMTVCNCNQS